MVFFTRQVERAVKDHAMFAKGDRVLCALSGGKDSLALASILKRIGHDVTGVHLDLGIPDSSVGARDAVQRFCSQEDVELLVIELRAEGLAIPEVKECVNRPVCSVCGKLKRYYFNKAALDRGFEVLATGHNLDDEAGRLLANTLRWDTAYLAGQAPYLPPAPGLSARARPLYRLGEFETAAYCFFNNIGEWTAPCPYSKGASFPFKKRIMNRLDEKSPGSKLSFYEEFLKSARPIFAEHSKKRNEGRPPCPECGYPAAEGLCGVCRLKLRLAG
jgi:uncharacterized protein (TIGR00269 family)